ncbi:hypothetical protein GCM10011409_38140 [Lentibacillus populi]|uniref:Uncharacterized protein n=1 Tax=Lentibacillus populi TaxID=1827502 RepID=A0A9W5U0R3_9BACI|nr:hypothetical protein [Lentibacillus populi]GGB56931.1 hypothetical protein GCM10011409_38140 [Lentibacillus populi]
MTNELKLIEDYNIPIVKIETDTNYWLVRTNSGEYFQDFFLENFVGINWNEFNNPDDFIPLNKEYTTNQIAKKYTSNKQPGHTFSHIKRFFHEIKIGDIVMIPSEDSKHIAFGKVTSDVYITEVSQTEIDEGACPYKKRRSVEWIKSVDRRKLDPYLYKMMNSHLTISNANDYADSIDRTLYSFYYKGDKAHLVLDVNQSKNIPLVDLLDALQTPLDLVELIHNPYYPEKTYRKKDLDAKIRVQSQGIIEFVSSGGAFSLVVLLGLGIVGLAGGKFKFNASKEKVEGELSTEGLLEKIFKLRDQTNKKDKQKEEIDELQGKFDRAKANLKIETPKELDSYFSEKQGTETLDD